MSDFGIKISLPGTAATDTNNPNDLILNARYPFHKLDVAKPASFQTINLAFAHNPPAADLSGAGFFPFQGYQRTVVYQFPHGYNYTPSTWMQNQNNLINIGAGASNALTYQGRRAIIATNATADWSAIAQLGFEVDDTNVYIVVIQTTVTYAGVTPTPINLVGAIFNLRVYVFAEDLANDIGS